MAVLAEAISVVVKRSSIDAAYPGGWRRFVRDCPNGTLCSDGELARFGFLRPDEVQEAIDRLGGEGGLVFFDREKAVDFAVVDQLRGPTTRCDWLQFARFKADDAGGRISAAWLYEGPRMGWGLHFAGNRPLQIATPPGWTYEGSVSRRFTFVPLEGVVGTEEFLSEEGFEIVAHDASGGPAFAVGGAEPGGASNETRPAPRRKPKASAAARPRGERE